MDRSDFHGAVNLLRRSLAIGATDDADRAATLCLLGVALGRIDDFHGSVDAFDEVVELATASGDRSLEWTARTNRADVKTWADPFGMTLDSLREELGMAIIAFDQLGDHAGLAAAWTKLVTAEFWPCHYDQGGLAADRAVQHARLSGDEHLLSEALLYLMASQSFGSAPPDVSLATLDALAQDIARSRELEASAFAFRGIALSRQGAFDQARSLISRGIEAAEALGMPTRLALHVHFAGDVESESGDLVAAERAYRRSYEIADRIGAEAYKTTPAVSLARTLCDLGRIDEAEEFAEIAGNASPADDLGPQSMSRSVRSLVSATRGMLDEAERLGMEALEIFAGAEDPEGQATIRTDRARVLKMAGRIDDAIAQGREALVLFERKGNRPSSDAARAFLEELGGSSP